MLILHCLGEAMLAQGMQGLMGMVPYGNIIYGVAKETIERYRERCRVEGIAADVEEMLQASQAEIVADAQTITLELAGNHSDDELVQLKLWLTHVPSIARQSLKRPADPTGKSVAPQLNLSDPQQLLTLLPQRRPRFKIGDEVPGNAQWHLVELLGSGGFGEVWLARHSFLGDVRAFKFCLDEQARDRLLQHEGEVVKRVMQASTTVKADEHGIVPLVDAYLKGDVPWLAYQYIDGGDLSALARELSALPIAERAERAMRILADLCEVIGRFHRLPTPIIHRDLKPANILIQRHGDRWLLKITDFGISHVAAARSLAQASVSTPQLSLGETYRGSHTPMYASPQQERGAKADPRDDVHALGVIGYQLLHGDVSKKLPRNDKWMMRLDGCGLSNEVLELLSSCWDDEVEERPADARTLYNFVQSHLDEKSLDMVTTHGVVNDKLICNTDVFSDENTSKLYTVNAPGTLYRRLASNPSDSWKRVFKTPISYVPQPNTEYMLRVRIPANPIVIDQLSNITQRSQIKKLEILSCRDMLSPEYNILSRLTCLNSLILDECFKINDSDIKTFGELKGLTQLAIKLAIGLTDDGLEQASLPTSLRSLSLSNTFISNRGISAIAKLRYLKDLSLTVSEQLTDEDIQPLTQLNQLSNLDLWSCKRLTDKCCKIIQDMKSLQSLCLGYCHNITNQGISNLQLLDDLRNLSLIGCRGINDSVLDAVKPLKNLIELDVRHCENISDDAIQQLRGQLPQCEIKR